MTTAADLIRCDSFNRGRFAVLVNGGVLIRCRTRTEQRKLVRDSANPLNPYKCIARRWRRR